AWNFGDGTTGTGVPVSHDYGPAFAKYTVDLSLTDALGAKAAATSSFMVYPASAHPYANRSDATWTFTQPGNPSSIDVTFGRANVESGFDYIYVMDKNGTNVDGSPFTGTSLAGTTKTLTGDTVEIRLTSDWSVTGFGFEVVNVTGAGGASVVARKAATSIAYPADGATVSGTTRIRATASGNAGVTKTELYIDGTLAASTASAGLTYSWNTSEAGAGSHAIVSKVYDDAENVRTSSPVTVTIVPSKPAPQKQHIRRHVSHSRSGG
ncbi:MAG: Ig-like domain-containing protein, partial [Acidobacteriota bacterium]